MRCVFRWLRASTQNVNLAVGFARKFLGSRVLRKRSHAKPPSRKNRHAESCWSGTRARLISPSSNFATNETLRFNIRHTATASADSADTRIAVGQAFQPDTSGCQAGKPDLLQTPLSSDVPGHCIFAYFLLCGFAALRENLRFLLQTTSKHRGRFGGRARRPTARRDSPAVGPQTPLRTGPQVSRFPSSLETCRSVQWQGRETSPQLVATTYSGARERAAKSALPSQALIRVRVRHGFGVIVKIMLVS